MVYNNEFYHYGILGQRWGVRRYQNEDGSLTNLAKNRNKKNDTNLKTSKKILNETSNITNELKKINTAHNNIKSGKPIKGLDKMSDQDLRNKVTRMNLERQYSDLTSAQVSKGRVDIGLILDGVGAILGAAGSAVGIALAIREVKKKS